MNLGDDFEPPFPFRRGKGIEVALDDSIQFV
jgi:hypothetical protein